MAVGFEVLLVIPILVIIGAAVIRNSQRTLFKRLHFLALIGLLIFFCFVYPRPLGVMAEPPYIYWAGCRRGPDWDRIQGLFRNFCSRYLDLEFME